MILSLALGEEEKVAGMLKKEIVSYVFLNAENLL